MSEDYIEATPSTELSDKMGRVARRLSEMGDGITLDKVVSDSLCIILDISGDLRQMYTPLVLGPTSTVTPFRDRKKQTSGLLQNALLDVLTVYHVCELDPPLMEEIEAAGEDVQDTIKVSGVLLSTLVSAAASDALMSYFVDDGMFGDDTLLLLHEIVAGIYLFCQKAEVDFQHLI